MKKRIFSLCLICILFLGIVTIIYFTKLTGKGIQVRVCNKADREAVDLYVTYTGSNEDISIPRIESGKTERIYFELPDEFDEGNVTLYYFDKSHEKHEVIIIGYIEKNRKCDVKLFVESIDSDGIIDMKID